jgi:Tfp pilus assembly protein PilF
MDEQRGKNLSRWAENDFEGAKSYHISGVNTSYFGAYWAKGNFGMMHYANRDEKVGKKFFTWALSDDGDIWVELLTDANGQYLEVQSGRLFNQNTTPSSLTPFKQFYFTPYGTDVWTEYWFPFKATGGVSDVSLYGVVNTIEKSGVLDFSLSPLQNINDTLKVYDAGGQLLSSQPANLSVAKPFQTTIRFPAGRMAYRVTLCNREIWSKEDKTMGRPSVEEAPFDYNTASGQYILGKNYAGMRLYDQAETLIRESLAKDPHFIPSLVEMSRLYYRRMEYDSAYFLARKALSFDTYNPDANFEFGRSARQSGRTIDALDGFEIAALTTPLRSAAYTELSQLWFIRQDYDKSAEYAEKSMINNAFNIEGLQMMYLNAKQKSNAGMADIIAARILALDPFNLMILFEKSGPEMSRFTEKLRSEMPVQSFLELAIRYYSLGLIEQSRLLLKAAPANGEVKWWLAFLAKDTPDEAALLKEAETQSPLFVFPFRSESRVVFEWAMSKSADWKPTYYLALLQGASNNTALAWALLAALGEKPDFAPFYSLRAQLTTYTANKERDLQKALSLSPSEWRYVHQLTDYYNEQKDYNRALQTVKPFYLTHKQHFPTASLYLRSLTYNKKYGEADQILNGIHILPFEGERGGRLIYREIKMMLAIQALAKGRTQEAANKVSEALLWPHRLGVGKPYDDQIDTRLEDWTNVMIAIRSKNVADKDLYMKRVAQSTHSTGDMATLLQCVACSKLGDREKAEKLFAEWSSLQRNNNVKEWGARFYKNNLIREDPFDLDEMTQLIGILSGGRDTRLF